MANNIELYGVQLRYRLTGICEYHDVTPENLNFIKDYLREFLPETMILKISFNFRKNDHEMILQYRQDEPGEWAFFNWENLGNEDYESLCNEASKILGLIPEEIGEVIAEPDPAPVHEEVVHVPVPVQNANVNDNIEYPF